MLYLLSQRYHWKHLKVASQLEDSLTVAASALALVKSVEPNIITIQVNNIVAECEMSTLFQHHFAMDFLTFEITVFLCNFTSYL